MIHLYFIKGRERQRIATYLKQREKETLFYLFKMDSLNCCQKISKLVSHTLNGGKTFENGAFFITSVITETSPLRKVLNTYRILSLK